MPSSVLEQVLKTEKEGYLLRFSLQPTRCTQPEKFIFNIRSRVVGGGGSGGGDDVDSHSVPLSTRWIDDDDVANEDNFSEVTASRR